MNCDKYYKANKKSRKKLTVLEYRIKHAVFFKKSLKFNDNYSLQPDEGYEIDELFGRFKIAALMHRCGVRKHQGHSVRSLTKTIFTLPFIGKNFFRGIVLNSELPFGKAAAYELLKGETSTGVCCNYSTI